MKHILLTISLILGATAVSANTKVWAFNITEVSVPMLSYPRGVSSFWFVYRDIEKCRSQLQTYVLRNTANSKVELKVNDTFDPLNPRAVLHNSIDGIMHLVECSPKILQD